VTRRGEEPVRRCESCGKVVATGGRFCPRCMKAEAERLARSVAPSDAKRVVFDETKPVVGGGRR
jgi:hypothetical protein